MEEGSFTVTWIQENHLPEVLDIERDSFPFPWTAENFHTFLDNRNSIGLVAMAGDHVAGYMLYSLRPHVLELVSIAVRRDMRHKGIATQLVEILKRKLDPKRRKLIVAHVVEDNLAACQFLSSAAVGMRAVSVMRGFYDGTSRDAIRFETPELIDSKPVSVPVAERFQLRNRISEFCS